MERALIYTLLDQVRDGKRADTRYKNEAWTACIVVVRAEYSGPEPEKKHLQAKYDWYKTHWKIWCDLDA